MSTNTYQKSTFEQGSFANGERHRTWGEQAMKRAAQTDAQFAAMPILSLEEDEASARDNY